MTVSSTPPMPAHSLWDAPRNAKSPALLGLDLQPPEADEVSELIKVAKENTRARVEAYETPVTEKTLRRNVR
jgi:hypothetical protein